MVDKDYTHIAMVVDRSGSMHRIANDMNGAILQLLSDQMKEPGYCLVDITTFDTTVEHPYQGVRPDDVKGEIILPRGSTALNDALGETIVTLGERFAGMAEEDRPGLVIFVVVTDGYENASREYTSDQIKKMVTEQTEKWGWQFIYLATGVDAFATGSDYGFARGSTIAFAGAGQNAYGATSSSLSAARGSASRGEKVDVSFSDEDRKKAMEE
jgi:uncharacterized protein YegL